MREIQRSWEETEAKTPHTSRLMPDPVFLLLHQISILGFVVANGHQKIIFKIQSVPGLGFDCNHSRKHSLTQSHVVGKETNFFKARLERISCDQSYLKNCFEGNGEAIGTRPGV